jgi:hypothetical protein
MRTATTIDLTETDRLALSAIVVDGTVRRGMSGEHRSCC